MEGNSTVSFLAQGPSVHPKASASVLAQGFEKYNFATKKVNGALLILMDYGFPHCLPLGAVPVSCSVATGGWPLPIPELVRL